MTNNDRRDWAHVFAEELAEVKKRRADTGAESRDVRPPLIGLAISGGGIRSATFGLGVLESLRRVGVLKQVDLLSTVSGGGYIGGWLSASCKRHRGWIEPDADWTASIGHLRRHSNYLSPTVGFFSADTWTVATVWLRNTLLIQSTVLLLIACALLLPRPLFDVFVHWPFVGNLRWLTVMLFVLGIVGVAGNQMRLTSTRPVAFLQATSWPLGLAFAAVCLVAAWMYGRLVDFDPFRGGEVTYSAAAPIAGLIVLAGYALQPVAVRLVASVWPDDDPPQQVNYTQNWVQVAVVAPLIVSGYLVAAILWGEATGLAGPGGLMTLASYGELFTKAWRYWPFPLSVVFASLWLLSFCSIRSRRDWRCLLAAVGAPVVSVTVLHALLSAIMLLLRSWADNPAEGAWRAFVWAPPLVALAFVLTIVVLIGMMGRESTGDVREWWSRLGAWLGIYASAWMALTVSAVYGPRLVETALGWNPWTSAMAGGGWLGTVVGGVFAGKSSSTSGDKEKSMAAKMKQAIAVAAPFVFIFGVVVGVSYVLDQVIQINAGEDWTSVGTGAMTHALHGPFTRVSLLVWGGCLGALFLMAARVDLNEFSLSAFYRNRLVRCYLGATRFNPGERNPQNFTGFDADDDLPLVDLVDRTHGSTGPLHVVNCALNLGGAGDLALHTRHSAAFSLTPLHCGSAYKSRDQTGRTEELGYVPTRAYGDPGSPTTLGQAVAVSGAAASPNMGYNTSPVVAFLLTLFNVRLGWWFANPGKAGAGGSSPHFSLRYLLAELFGGASDKSKFVMISDGGHFENLAAYELVRRGCRMIIISDGECDPKLAFNGLGTLIRMCEVDFGARITVDVSKLRPTGAPWSPARYALGRVQYGDDRPDGILIYLKASMNGQEDTSVLQYKDTHPAFPHESTGDQFYGEDQFESYRHLGREVGEEAFGTVPNDLLAWASAMLK